jgi:hypothetical protein
MTGLRPSEQRFFKLDLFGVGELLQAVNRLNAIGMRHLTCDRSKKREDHAVQSTNRQGIKFQRS